MWLSRFFSKKSFREERIKFFYSNSERLVEFEFANQTSEKKIVWVEPTCVEIELDADTEFKIVTHDKFFRVEFDDKGGLIFYLQYSFGFKLYKRQASKEITSPNIWELDVDTSHIN
jgi:hypothetical protein